MRIKLCSLLFVFFFHGAFAQNTVGVLTYEQGTYEGYSFFSPFNSTRAFIIDNCGNLINEWQRGTKPGLSAYFLDSGLLFRTYKVSPLGPFTSASNAGGLELVNWVNETVWSYEINTTEQLSHHDAVMMPNGHILVLTWVLVYEDDLIEWGRNPNEIAAEKYMWSERILELKPIGDDDAEIVWEWNIYDHYIQDYDSTKTNFGVVADHPERFDINLPDINSSNSNASRDWNHFNAIDYNENLDQILLSVRNSDEIWILDHSTTTEEAATSEGGLRGKGGDILYRYGNVSAYQQGSISEQVLFGQHGVHWIKEDLPHAGKILVFNNGNERPGPDFSEINVIVPEGGMTGEYVINGEGEFGTTESLTVYNSGDNDDLFSRYLSNAQYLENGNLFINEGSPGRLLEVNQEGDIVWEYEIPLFGDFPATQGQQVNNNSNFRGYKYGKDYAGFMDIEIIVDAPIEQNPVECQLLVGRVEVEREPVNFWYLPASGEVMVNGVRDGQKLEIFSILGERVGEIHLNENQDRYLLDNLQLHGVVLLKVGNHAKYLWIE